MSEPAQNEHGARAQPSEEVINTLESTNVKPPKSVNTTASQDDEQRNTGIIPPPIPARRHTRPERQPPPVPTRTYATRAAIETLPRNSSTFVVDNRTRNSNHSRESIATTNLRNDDVRSNGINYLTEREDPCRKCTEIYSDTQPTESEPIKNSIDNKEVSISNTRDILEPNDTRETFLIRHSPMPTTKDRDSERQSSLKLFDDSGIYQNALAKISGDATDVIAVRGNSGTTFAATNFNVRFTGSSAKKAYRGSKEKRTLKVFPPPVEVKINGKTCFSMVLEKDGVCRFKHGSLQCCDETLSQVKQLQFTEKIKHELVYEHKYTSVSGDFHVAYVRANFWIWNYDDIVLVSDVDGTITRSDVRGLFHGAMHSRMGGHKAGYAHEGVCELYNQIEKGSNCKVLYLTARPLTLVKQTRDYIIGLEQGSNAKLPDGPVITDTTNLLGSFSKEVIHKTSHVFKSTMLLQLKLCFIKGGRDALKYPVFVATFGNKMTDCVAYESAGAPRLTMFRINTASTIVVMEGDLNVPINSYDDPRLAQFILQRVHLIKIGKLPPTPRATKK